MSIHQKIRRLHVAMEYVRAVEKLESTESLVHEVANVLVGELHTRLAQAVQVGVHEARDDVDRVHLST